MLQKKAGVALPLQRKYVNLHADYYQAEVKVCQTAC